MISIKTMKELPMKRLTNNEINQKKYFDDLAIRRQEVVNLNRNKSLYIEEDVYTCIMKYPKTQKILEIGCGDGEGGGFTEYFVARGLEVAFLDISSESVSRLAEKLEKSGYKGFMPLSGTFKDVAPKLSGEKYDLVFFGDTLHHLTECETISLIEEIIPFMHKHTKIVAFEPNGNWPFWRIMPRFNKDFIWEVEKNIVHCTRSGFARKFSAVGMNLEDYSYYRIVPLFLMNKWKFFRAINKQIVRIPLLRLLSAYTILVGSLSEDLVLKK